MTSVLVVLALLAAVLRARLAARETLRAALVTMTAAGAVGTVDNVMVLNRTVSITTESLVAQVAVAIAPLVLALLGARWIGLCRAE